MKTKKSKKPLLIVAICLMVALVMGMGAMTYARYVSTTELGSTQATAAMWGYVVTTDASEMFGTDYTKNGTFATVVDENGVAIKSSSENLVLAPGSTGSIDIIINGTAEVLAEFSITIDALNSKVPSVDVTVDEETTTYAPILWSLKEDGVVVDEDMTLAELVTAAADFDATLTPGTELVNKTYTISWEWPLDSGNDGADTAIGLTAAEEDIDEAVYSNVETQLVLDLSVTIRQIQE